MAKRHLIAQNAAGESTANYDDYFKNDLTGLPFRPPARGYDFGQRDENPVVYLEFCSPGGRQLNTGQITDPKNLGRLYFELRNDLVPVACANFLALCTGVKGYGEDGVRYSYKDRVVHRIVKNVLFQSGDLLDSKGECSRSIYNAGGLFRDENFIFRHTGAGCLSYCNRGPDTNGSLFQVCFTENADLDNKYVVFGCLANKESYDCLGRINSFGTDCGEPLEEIRISDCGVAFPEPKRIVNSNNNDNNSAHKKG